jgi:hypothetical protein
VAAGYAVSIIGREAETSLIEIATEHLRKTELVDRAIATIEALDTGRINI